MSIPGSFAIPMSTTLPTGSGTTVLFNSVTAAGAGAFRALPIARISFGVFNDQAGTLKASKSTNGGATWDVFDSRAVTIPAANNISGPYDYLVDTYLDFKLEWVNGGSDQTTWRAEMHGHENRQPGT